MALSVGRMVRTFLFIIPQFKVPDIALYQREIPSNLRSWRVPKAHKPPMSKEYLSEHSCRKNETSQLLLKFDRFYGQRRSRSGLPFIPEPLIQKPFAVEAASQQ